MARDLALTVSARCRAQHGFPHRPATAGCTGCGCGCHAVRPPANFRQLAYAARDQARARAHAAETPDGEHRGEAVPLDGLQEPA
jgi:hypothetical protein